MSKANTALMNLGRTESGIHLVIINPRDLGPSRFAEGTWPSVLESQTTNKQTIK